MKVIHDDDLSILHAYTQKIAKHMASLTVDYIIKEFENLFKYDDKFGYLNYSGLMTFTNTVGMEIACKLFLYSCQIGKQFPDVDHSSREIFEELQKGMRILVNMPEINEKEYTNGIKKIHLEE